MKQQRRKSSQLLIEDVEPTPDQIYSPFSYIQKICVCGCSKCDKKRQGKDISEKTTLKTSFKQLFKDEDDNDTDFDSVGNNSNQKYGSTQKLSQTYRMNFNRVKQIVEESFSDDYNPKVELVVMKQITNVRKSNAGSQSRIEAKHSQKDQEEQEDNILSKIISKNKQKLEKSVVQKYQSKAKEEKCVCTCKKNDKYSDQMIKDYKKKQNQNLQFGFNNRVKVPFPQTPGFISLLDSPFGKFNKIFKHRMETINKQNLAQLQQGNNESYLSRTTYQTVDPGTSPLKFYNKPNQSKEPKNQSRTIIDSQLESSFFQSSKYFIGMALYMKEKQLIGNCLFLCHLGCYTQPFSDKSWRKYISILEEYGKLDKALIMAKTGFLFTQNQQLLKSYLNLSEKCLVPLQKIQGVFSSLSNPQILEKSLLPQSCKLQLKYGTRWKPLKVLLHICQSNGFKLPVCATLLYLARYLQNMGQPDSALQLLKYSFNKSMSKFEVYNLYLLISLRKNKYLVEQDLQEVLKYCQCISSQNRYKLFLGIAEIMYKNGDGRCYQFFQQAFRYGFQYCGVGTGVTKALKAVYYSLAKLKGAMPFPISMSPYYGGNIINIANDTVIFQINRYRFVNGLQLIQYQFQDWKFYLHYGIIKRYDLLINASKAYPLTGRIIAELIHCLRVFRRPLQMLKIWRQKIDLVPKSGELWCEGGRIYVELGQYKNAQFCFKCAMHFTPQYGDSFIEQLRIYLRDGRFLEIQKLKKLFLCCEPFYGHVLSYLQEYHWQAYLYTTNLNQLWQNAVYQICQDLYKHGSDGCNNSSYPDRRLFTAFTPYNRAYIYQSTKQQRQKLFISYQQMQNKN